MRPKISRSPQLKHSFQFILSHSTDLLENNDIHVIPIGVLKLLEIKPPDQAIDLMNRFTLKV